MTIFLIVLTLLLLGLLVTVFLMFKRVQGQIDAGSRDDAVRRLRQSAILPIDVTPGNTAAQTAGTVQRTGKTRTAITRAVGELAVLLKR